MEKIKMLITRMLLPQDVNYIRSGLDKEVKGQYDLLDPQDYSERNLVALIDDIDILLGPYVTKQMISKAHRLKLIQIPWTGLDSFNFDEISEYEGVVCNSHSNSSAVAEFGVAILLDLLKKISYHNDILKRADDWNRKETEYSLKSRMLKNENVFILGYGNIGSKIASYLKSFQCTITGFRNHEKYFDNDILIDNIENINSKLSECSVLINCLPLTASTKDFINKDFLNLLDKQCIIINLSRAEVVNENDLYYALVGKKIAGYGSDVWWKSPQRSESYCNVSNNENFKNLPNVILSPHRAAYIENSLPHLDDVITNLINFIQNKDLISVVSKDKKY